jgi:peroxiredoxin
MPLGHDLTEKIMPSLQGKLDAFTAVIESGEPPYSLPRSIIDAMHKSVEELVASGQAERAKKAGDTAPTFSLEDANGQTVSLSDLLAKGPAVLMFYRGVWCPYCNIEMVALEEARGEIESRGATLVAGSPQTAAHSRGEIDQKNLGFPILSDPRGEITDAYGVRFTMQDYLVDIYKNTLHADLAEFNEDPSWTLPMPARYIIGQDGVIAYAEVSPDHAKRPEPSELLPTLDRLSQSKAA